MSISVFYFETPLPAYEMAKSFLEQRPILNNLNLTLLEERISKPQPGRYWVVTKGEDVVGFSLQSPLNYGINLAFMDGEIISELVKFIALQKFDIPFVNGDSLSASLFAGYWTESHNSGAIPELGMRIYEKEKQNPIEHTNGTMRQAVDEDLDLLTSWTKEFIEATGGLNTDVRDVVKARLKEERFWIWEDKGPVSFVCISNPVHGVVRVQMVFTPKAERGKLYARSCVNELSNSLLLKNQRVMLYADLGNPISNFVFRSVGFGSKVDCLKYVFVKK
ncbi:MAG: hypothetical protein GQ574_04215 [Crocinitomix sp.]|nr:hypothetical protein [Crocinitomix sp.]